MAIQSTPQVWDPSSGKYVPAGTQTSQPAATAPAPTAAPTSAFPQTLTLDQALAYAKNPKSVPGGGDYNIAQVANYGKVFDALKQGMLDGKLTMVDYQNLANPLAKATQSAAMAIGGGGSKAASAVNPVWMNIISSGYIKPDGGSANLNPFTQQEMARLPENVLPNQNDINSGMYDPIGAPLQRVRKDPVPAVNPGMDPNKPTPPVVPGPGSNPQTTPASSTPNSQVQNSPVFSANPNDPPPYGGLQSTNAGGSYDAQRIAQEAALQQQLATQAQEGITSARQKYLSDLTGLINENTNKQMSEATPGIFEELNSKGLLRSSDLGNQLAIKAKSLNADASNQLAQYGIQGETADLGNLTNIQNTYNAGRNSALAREFSVEDYSKQVQTGKEMGQEYAKLAPQAPSTKSQMEVAATGGAASGLSAKAAK